MSELIGEAQILIRPDTSKFRVELQTQLARVTKGITVPVTIVPSVKGAALTAGFSQLSHAQDDLKNKSLETSGAMKSIDEAAKKNTQSLLGVNNAASRLNAGLLGLRTALGSTAVIGLGAVALAAIAAGQAVRAAVINFASFEQELNTFRVVTGATAEQMETVRQTAIALGEDVRLPGVSAADAAIALTELSKAGLSVQESLAGVEGVLQLATAAQISNADAALIAANALNSFGLQGSEATHVADTLANAANAAQGSISDFGLALKQSSAVARQVGLSLEDTTALLSLFAKNGLQGSDAGTSLRVALIRLVAPTKDAKAEIEDLGLKIRDAQGNVRADVFAQFGEATRDLAPAARDAAAALIFGQDSIRALSIGAREGVDGLRLMQFQIDQQGTAAEVAAARTQGLAGALSALQNAGEGLSITFGRLLSGPLGQTARNFAIVAAAVDKLIQSSERLGPSTLDQNSRFDQLSGHLRDVAKTVLVPGEGFKKLAFLLDSSARAAAEADEKFQKLNSQLQGLQDARVLIEGALSSDLAAGLTSSIEGVREQITALERESQGLSATVDPLADAVTLLERVRDVRLDLDLPVTSINIFIRRLEEAANEAGQATIKINNLPDGITKVGTSAKNAASSVDALTAALKGLGQQSSALQDQLLVLQNQGAGPQAQISNLQQQRAGQFSIIENLKANGIQAGDPSAIRAAREEINSINAEIASLQAEIAADARKATDDAKKLADDAQDQRDKQFQAIADTFGGRQTNIENQIERAGIAGNIQKQIKLTQALIASLKKERDALLDRLKKLKISNEVRKRIMQAITAAIEEGQQDILRLQKEQADNIKEFSTPAIDLRIRIAQARDNTQQEIRLRRQRLELIRKELERLAHAGKKNTLAWLELKAQQAEEAAAIKELENETKKKNNAQQSAFFTFLQTQSGFAANLLGNLIPGFATRGLVGGSSAASGPAAGAGFPGALSPEEHGFGPKSGAQASAAVGASRTGTVRPVQVDTTNQLLRQILGALQGKKNPAPEAVYNRYVATSLLDIY